MPNARQALFPYGMSKNEDGSWTFFNRQYKPVGVCTKEWSEWDDPRHKLRLNGLGKTTLARLAFDGKGLGDRIYFYDDGSNPELSEKNLNVYLKKLAILIKLQEAT